MKMMYYLGYKTEPFWFSVPDLLV